jgi:hypothetical protein
MCVVVPHDLEKGAAALPRFIPQSRDDVQALSLPIIIQTYRCLIPHKETALSLYPSPISWRPKKGAFALPFLGTFPSTWAAFLPPRPQTNPTRFGCRQLVKAGPEHKVVESPVTGELKGLLVPLLVSHVTLSLLSSVT